MQASQPRQERSKKRSRTANRGTVKDSAKPRRETFTIGFRVDAQALAQLERGGAPYGLSAHEHARQLVLESLEDLETAQIIATLTQILREGGALREEMRLMIQEATLIILTNLVEGEPHRLRAEVEQILSRAIQH